MVVVPIMKVTEFIILFRCENIIWNLSHQGFIVIYYEMPVFLNHKDLFEQLCEYPVESQDVVLKLKS